MTFLCLIGRHAIVWSAPDLESETQHGICSRPGCGIAKERML